MTDAFISYSRRDKAFVKQLHQAFIHHQYDVWVDWEDIPLTADWWAEIQEGIEAADNFIFVISPDSVVSQVCRQEIDHAVTSHKRLIPIVYREGFVHEEVRPALRQHNWLFFTSEGDFNTTFQALAQAIETDLAYVKFHTRLLVRSQEWDKKGRRSDFLLRGHDLEESANWLAEAYGQKPSPSGLQREFIFDSQTAETVRQRRERRQLQIFGGVVASLAIAALGFAVFAWQQRGIARRNEQEAIAQRENAYQQTKIAFAHQLAEEVMGADPASMLSLRMISLENTETVLAFGLASLPPTLASTLQQHNPRLIAISLNNSYVGIITEDYQLRVWQVDPWRQVLSWQDPARVVEVGFSPDESLLTVATEDGMLHIWQTNRDRYSKAGSLKAHGAALTDTAFSPNGQMLATASLDGTARVWDLTQMLNIETYNTDSLRHDSPVLSVSFDPENSRLITGSESGQLTVWSLVDQQPQLCIAHNHSVSLVRFNSIEGEVIYLGSVSNNTLVRIWSWRRLIQTPEHFDGVAASCNP